MATLQYEPIVIVRALCADSLVMLWYSQLTGELYHATFQSWN